MMHFVRLIDRLVRLVGLGLCCSVGIAHADSLCGDLDARTARFVETLQQHAAKTTNGGQFQVQRSDLDGGKTKFAISYRGGSAERFHLNVTPNSKNGEEFAVTPFRTREGGALFVRVGFGGSNGVACGYLIHANADRFRFEKIEGVFNATDLDRDGTDEIVVFERQDWAERCDTRISWRRIYHLDPGSGRLVDASKDFRSFYSALEKEYQRDESQYTKSASPLKNECKQQFAAIAGRASALASGGSQINGAGPKRSATPAERESNPTIAKAAPSSGEWRELKLGETGNGIAFRRTGNDAIAFFGNTPVAKCVAASGFQGERRQYLADTLKLSRVHVSPPSPKGQFIAVFCGAEADSARGVQLVNLKSGTLVSPSPRDLFRALDPWISFSPDERYAVLNQAGDEGDYAPLVLTMSTGRAAKLQEAPLFPHDEKSQPVWINDRTIKYRVGQICDNKADDCKSLGIYDFEVDVAAMKAKRKRIADWRWSAK